MKVIRPVCRTRFTSADFDFVLSVLGGDSGERDGLARLFHDPEALDLILDHRDLLYALLEERQFLGVSSCFYFYILVRHALLDAGIEDRELADYVAELLAEFSATRRMRHFTGDWERATDYFVDLAQEMREADELTRFLLALHIGNYALFIAGLFADHIEYRARRRAAPGLSYYEALGQGNFHAARSHRLAQKFDLAPVLLTLTEQFRQTREILNDISERLLIWGEADLA